MRKLVGIIFILGLFSYFVFTKKGTVARNVAYSYVIDANFIEESGTTVSERILTPENFRRAKYPEGSFSNYIQNYALKSFDAKIINFDGEEYIYQKGHVGVLEVPVPKNGLQQCADALIRIRSEYLWEQNRKSEIGFNFTSGHYCSWKKYAEGYRPKVKGNNVTFHKTASKDTSKENFYKYLNLIYIYAGTQSLYTELKKIEWADDLEVGDMIVKPGFPGHIVMIADKATDANGKNLFILAQGNTPAQSVHLLKNLNDSTLNPWYELEANAYLEIPTYYFNQTKFVRFK
ncbi:DUF4846 domain-containing protein [Rasiella rasia]|uniref:DUF4846 domain-containing protein n=1 Tax=Rasiella rasia TaxID=2744027 RepID=A0A6G6GPQ6_9FLAO|nr:DUF4846 domain-containing protein [Rasiella rasia]QIE60450.1 DUF4846 domain-containing protein [Rasiella rasia]